MSDEVKWPDHAWAGDEHGHACAKCEEACPWYCDKIAHTLGETERGLKLLDAIRTTT
jgi:NAD-dependent dihydropyrimidine dehydrogenase PreA subunit